MTVAKGFQGGFGGCFGVGCALALIAAAVPVGCIVIGGTGFFAMQKAQERGKELREKYEADQMAKSSSSASDPPATQQRDPEPAKTESHPTHDVAATKEAVSDSEYRTWTDTKGRKLEAAFVALKGDSVTFRKRDGKKLTIPLSKLSDDDQALLRQHEGGE